MAEEFNATIDRWIEKSKKRMLIIAQQSTQDLVKIMQKPVGAGGNMPVDTGFLRASLETRIGTLPTGYKQKTSKEPNSYKFDDAQYTLTINRMKLGDTIYGVYLASYAIDQEYGSQGRTGRGFVRLAAQQWQRLVRENVRKARNIR